MKKQVQVALLSCSLTFTPLAFSKKSDFTLINSTSGLKTYLNRNQDIAIIEANTGYYNFKLGITEEGNRDHKGNRTFKKYGESITKHFTDNNKNNKLYMALNGQFFAFENYTPLSYSTKKDGDILQIGVREEEYDKRLLAFSKYIPLVYSTRNQYAIEKIVKHNKIDNAIVGLNPFDDQVKSDFRSEDYIARHLIGCIPYEKYKNRDLTVCKKLLFIVAKRKPINHLVNELRSWGVNDKFIIQMDGSDSAQAYSGYFQHGYSDFYMRNLPRDIPNSILIYKR